MSERLPGPVPVDGAEGKLVWPTWREALIDAHVGVESAYRQRQRIFQAAYDAGLTLRQIATAVELTPAGIHKIIGKQRGAPDALLDELALQPRSLPPREQGATDVH